jgi:hypothetical protein
MAVVVELAAASSGAAVAHGRERARRPREGAVAAERERWRRWECRQARCGCADGRERERLRREGALAVVVGLQPALVRLCWRSASSSSSRENDSRCVCVRLGVAGCMGSTGVGRRTQRQRASERACRGVPRWPIG